MDIIKARAYVGPNIIATTPLVHLRVDVEGPQHWPDDDTDPRYTDALLRLLPGLAGHPGKSNEPNGFVVELRASPGLPLGYVVARIATELQRKDAMAGSWSASSIRRPAGSRTSSLAMTTPTSASWPGRSR